MHCRVVTWNIHSFVGSDGRYDVDRVADVLAGLDADIIGLQEVDWRRKAVGGGEAFDEIASRLGMNAVEGPNLHDHRGRYGNGLLTRFTVRTVQQISLAYQGREPRGAIDATLDANGVGMRIFVTHLGLKYRERRHQMGLLRELAASENDSEPTLLLGDMNEWLSSRLVRRVFTPKPFDTLVSGRSFPSRWPLFSLDCIFIAPRPARVESAVITSPDARLASDHLPVMADITWGGGGK